MQLDMCTALQTKDLRAMLCIELCADPIRGDTQVDSANSNGLPPEWKDGTFWQKEGNTLCRRCCLDCCMQLLSSGHRNEPNWARNQRWHWRCCGRLRWSGRTRRDRAAWHRDARTGARRSAKLRDGFITCSNRDEGQRAACIRSSRAKVSNGDLARVGLRANECRSDTERFGATSVPSKAQCDTLERCLHVCAVVRSPYPAGSGMRSVGLVPCIHGKLSEVSIADIFHTESDLFAVHDLVSCRQVHLRTQVGG
eukprot:2258270-Prymnesium_polylepis.2